MLVQRLQRLCSPSRKRRGCSVTLQVIFRRSPDRGRQPQKVYRRRSSGSKTFSPRYYSNRSILWADSKKAVGRPRVCAILSVTTPESPAVPTDRAVAMPKKKKFLRLQALSVQPPATPSACCLQRPGGMACWRPHGNEERLSLFSLVAPVTCSRANARSASRLRRDISQSAPFRCHRGVLRGPPQPPCA